MEEGKFIESVYVDKLEDGTIHVLINTVDKWVDYVINRITKPEFDGGIVISIDIPTPEYSHDYFIPIKGYKSINYIAYSMQEKDQINIMCVPRTKLINRESKKVEPKKL